jgi:ABC-type polysaccharide/polyol phosphate transport system ATPase subunit
LLKEWCTKGLFIQQGKLVAYGPIDEVAAIYEKSVD